MSGMPPSCSIGILGGFGPHPTADLYLRLGSAVCPRPNIVIWSPAIESRSEAHLLESGVEPGMREGIIEAFRDLCALSVTTIAIPSVTVASVLLEMGHDDARVVPWFDAVLHQVEASKSRRLGIIATSTVSHHSPLVRAISARGIEVVPAPRLSSQFHSWVLQSTQSEQMLPFPPELLRLYREAFAEGRVDACLLGCTEACLCEGQMEELGVPLVNALSSLFGLLKQACGC